MPPFFISPLERRPPTGRKIANIPTIDIPSGVAGCDILPKGVGEYALFQAQAKGNKAGWMDVLVSVSADARVIIRSNPVDLGFGAGGGSNPYNAIEIPLDVGAWYGTNAGPGAQNPPSTIEFTAGTTDIPFPVGGAGDGYFPHALLAANTPVQLPSIYIPPGGYSYVGCNADNIGMSIFAVFFEASEQAE